ncbi:hypothetical protein ACFSYD_00870 [Paracoccus aerius]
MATYYLTIPLVRRYHRRKSQAMAARIAKVRAQSTGGQGRS